MAIVPGDKADCIPGSSACAVSIYARAGARDEKSNTEAPWVQGGNPWWTAEMFNWNESLEMPVSHMGIVNRRQHSQLC